MDSYLYNLDPYRQSSASYYTARHPASYGLDSRSTYGLPPADPLSSYSRVPLDPYSSVYGAPPPSFHPDIVAQPRYVPVSPPSFRPRPRPTQRRKASPPPKLGLKKQPFKQTQKGRFTDSKQQPLKQDMQKNKPAPQVAKKNSNSFPSSQASSLAKETQELHKLFRTGLPSNAGKKGEGSNTIENGTGKKRKAETQMQKPTPTNGPDSAKKQKGKKKQQPLKKEKKADVMDTAEPPVPLEELCKGVKQFLGIPETEEVADAIVANEAVDVSKPDAKEEAIKEAGDPPKPEEASKETGDPPKPEEASKETAKKLKGSPEPLRTPEQVKEVEANSFKFFSSLFEKHKELRDYCIEKCKAGSFQCLVCHSIKFRKGKKTFANVESLFMHTKMCKQWWPEHGGYGRAICAVLGWDYEKTAKVPRVSKPNVHADEAKEERNLEADLKPIDQDKKEAEIISTEGQDEKVSENPPAEEKVSENPPVEDPKKE